MEILLLSFSVKLLTHKLLSAVTIEICPIFLISLLTSWFPDYSTYFDWFLNSCTCALMFLFLNIFALLLMPHKPQIFYSSIWPAFRQGMPARYLIGVWAHTCVCVYVHTHFNCSSETPKMSNDLESSRVEVGQLKWVYRSENCAYTYMSKCFTYFDSVVVSPFLDPFSFVKSSVCMNCVQVSSRHRLPFRLW